MALAGVGRVAALDPTARPSNYIATHWDTETGLPHNAVKQIFQTRDGYLWLGTLQGLARFDGIKFTIFSPHNTPGILNGQITSLAETPDGSLWIATSYGLTRYQNGKFRTYTHADGVKSTSGTYNALCVMPDGSLWIGGQNGVTRWVDGRFVQDIDTSGLNTLGMRQIVVDRTGTGRELDTGVAPVYSPSGRRFAAADLGEAGYGALNAFAVWQVERASIRQLAKHEEIPDATDWTIERWVGERCLELSAIPWDGYTGQADAPRDTYRAREAGGWRIEPGRCTDE